MGTENLKALSGYTPIPWSAIPDLGLYMDQVITLITRMYEPLYGDATCGYLSASMINNYVKAKLIPRPTGKKYGREQIALLTMIVSLKQVATMEDIRAMLTPAEDQTVEDLYALFCAQQQAVIAQIASANEKAGRRAAGRRSTMQFCPAPIARVVKRCCATTHERAESAHRIP